MPNLLPTATFNSGDYDANIYVRKGDPILTSPLIIESQDLSTYATLTVSGAGVSQGALQVSTQAGANVDFSGMVDTPNVIIGNPEVQNPVPVDFAPNFNNLRPVFWDTVSNKLTIAQEALIRFFQVPTPIPTGSQVVITDPNGNTYSDPDWLCCVAGFVNASGDRTYNCVTIQTTGSPWKVQYDNAGTSSGNYVNILAIHRSLLTCG